MRRNQCLPAVLLVLVFIFLIPFTFAQAASHLQIIMIGNGPGPYYAPAGESVQLKFEIFNAGPGDIYLDEGSAFLDPDLNGNWQLIHSESLGNFYVAELRSAIWTLNLTVPSNIQAPNATNGIPQVALLLKITYSTTSGLQQAEQGIFQLSVPGATLKSPNYLSWIVGIIFAVVVVVVSGVLLCRRKSKRDQNSSVI